jgi:AraC-like DNA-binding protein
MSTTTIDMFVLLYNIKYAETWLFYTLFAILLYHTVLKLRNSSKQLLKSPARLNKSYLAFHDAATLVLPPMEKPKTTNDPALDEYRKNEELKRMGARLQQLMETEKLYQEPELTLGDLAKKLQTNSSVLSRVINQCFMLNFNDYVNKHRVEDVIEKMNNPKFSNQTLLSIAFDAGFNSKSTFNRAFLKFKETTPRYYYQSLQLEKEQD